MNTDKIRLYASKTAERKEMEAIVASLKSELATIEAELLEEFAEAGVVRETVETPYGNFNVGPRSQLWASAPDGSGAEGKDYAKGCEALRAVGWGDFVQERFNTMTLSSHVREMVKMGLAILETTEGGSLVLKSQVPGQAQIRKQGLNLMMELKKKRAKKKI